MTSIHYRLSTGEVHTVEAVNGESVMRTALANDVPGIVGECGGQLSCATCHVYVDAAWSDRLEPASGDEEDMLEAVDNRNELSRLSCQIRVTPDLVGLEVEVGAN